MRILCWFAMVVFMTTIPMTTILMNTVAQAETLPAPQAVTDPKQITSKPDARVEKNLSIEKLYMTRQIGGATWSPDGKTVAFISNISGRNNIWLVPCRRRMADATDGQRPAADAVRRGRPTESGSPTYRTTTATSSGTFFWSRPRPAKS